MRAVLRKFFVGCFLDSSGVLEFPLQKGRNRGEICSILTNINLPAAEHSDTFLLGLRRDFGSEISRFAENLPAIELHFYFFDRAVRVSES